MTAGFPLQAPISHKKHSAHLCPKRSNCVQIEFFYWFFRIQMETFISQVEYKKI